jgi:GT2 family glycosyltransferase
MLLSAVIVAWRSADRLASCIAALREAAVAADGALQIVVVDNGPAGDHDAVVGDVDILVANPVNAGFAVGANQGIAAAEGAWVALVNADITVDRGFFAAVAEAVGRADADVAMIVPDVRFESDGEIVNHRGISVDALGIPHEVASGVAAAHAIPDNEPFGGSGGASVVRTAAFEAVGGFEPLYFAYLEDVDLAWKLRRAGWRATFVPSARVTHAGSASTGEGSPLKTYLVARNRRLLFRVNGPNDLRTRAARSALDAGHMAYECIIGRRREAVTGRVAAFRLRSETRLIRDARAREAAGAVLLAPRIGIAATIRRKRRSRTLMVGRVDAG